MKFEINVGKMKPETNGEINGGIKFGHKLIEPLAENGFDAALKEALRARAAAVAVPASLDEKVFQSLGRARFSRGRARPRGFFGRKLAAALCALFCLSCAGALASGGLGEERGWVSHIGPEYSFEGAAGAAAALAYLDFSPEYPETLAGDWRLVGGHICKMQRLDANGRRMSHVYKELFLEYLNAASGERLLLVAGIVPDTAAAETVSGQPGEIALSYAEQQYKFVPLGYELTEDDLARLADGSLEISVGADEVELKFNTSVHWARDGVYYTLFGWDLELSAEEMLNMAAQIAGVNE